MSANTAWGAASIQQPPPWTGLWSPDGMRVALGYQPGPRPMRFVFLCSRCDQPYDLPAYHSRLHARGKKPRCRT